MATSKTNTAKPSEPEAPAAPAIGSAFADLLGEVQRDVVGWIPENVGDTLAGVIVGDEIITTSFVDQATGETVTSDLPVSVFDVNPADPSLPFVRFVWMGTVLLNAYRRHQPTRLDQAAVRLTRKSGGTGVGDYDDWRVVVHKAPENQRPSVDLGTTRRTATPAAKLAEEARAGSPGETPFGADPGEEQF